MKDFGRQGGGSMTWLSRVTVSGVRAHRCPYADIATLMARGYVCKLVTNSGA